MKFWAASRPLAVRRPVLVLVVAAAAAVTAGITVPVTEASGVQTPASAGQLVAGSPSKVPGQPIARGDTGKSSSMQKLDLGHMGSHHRFASHGVNRVPLGPDGHPIGANLPRRPVSGHRTTPASVKSTVSVKSMVSEPASKPIVLTASVKAAAPTIENQETSVFSSFDGSHEANCNCLPADPSAAASASYISEVAGNQLQSYDGSGNLFCSTSLNTLLQTSDSLTNSRIQYDDVWNRFSLVVEDIPSSASAPPSLWVAATQTGNPCGIWNTYHLGFNENSVYPAGAFLDFPQFGQDSGGLLISTNNFNFSEQYLGSFAFSLSKSAIYNGQGVGYSSYQVDYDTAPAVVAGDPIESTSTTYWVAARPGTGYDVFSMPAGGGTVSFTETVNAPFTAPQEQVEQPGTSVTLNPGGGYIMSPPAQDGGFIWFTNDIDDAGFPTVQYGDIDVSNDTAYTALAFHAGDSEDFNPSIGVLGQNSGGVGVWLNWSYTETPEGVAVSDTMNGDFMFDGPPGFLKEPNPDLIGSDTTLAAGSSSSQSNIFGFYSSVAIDPMQAPTPQNQTCDADVVTDQQYFDASGNWVTHLSQTETCSVIPR